MQKFVDDVVVAGESWQRPDGIYFWRIVALSFSTYSQAIQGSGKGLEIAGMEGYGLDSELNHRQNPTKLGFNTDVAKNFSQQRQG